MNDIDAAAGRILRDNDRGGYTVPSARLYPFQWNWDSLFVALGWAAIDRGRAWTEIDSLLSAQWPSGMVPHIVFWTEQPSYFPGPEVWRTDRSPMTSGISQPPVAATVIRTMWPGGLCEGDVGLLHRFEALDRWHEWWHRARDPGGSGLIAILHPWESGRDNLPDWDRPLAAVDTSRVASYQRRDLDVVDPSMRPHAHDYDRYVALVDYGVSRGWGEEGMAANSPFRVADPGLTAILLRAERDLAWLGTRLGRDVAHIESRVTRLATAFEQFWNPAAQAYCSIDLRTGTQAVAGTSASFLAPYAGVTDRLEELVGQLDAWGDACRYLVPSFDPRHPAFEPTRYWRGPVWPMINYLIADGLSRAGVTERARRIHADTAALTRLSGMSESWDPISGGAVGAPRFSWTAAIWLTWAGREFPPDPG